jgi:hypothetical protein
MQSTALKNFYARITFLLFTVLFFLSDSSIPFIQQNGEAKPVRLAIDGNQLPLAEPNVHFVIQTAGKRAVAPVSGNDVHALIPEIHTDIPGQINYTPQSISDIIKECPA